MNKAFLLLFLTSNLLFCRSSSRQDWDSKFEVTLKKDVPVEFNIKDKIRAKKFKFHWTLFINKGLVVVANYDGFPHQYVLYQTSNLNSFKLALANAGGLVFVEFSEFVNDSKEAKFKVMFKNSKAEMLNQNTNPNTNQK